MWQLEIDATKASSGSTLAGLEYGTGTTEGEGEAGTVKPPSKLQVCSREYLPLRKSGVVRFQLMTALCSDMRHNDVQRNHVSSFISFPVGSRFGVLQISSQ